MVDISMCKERGCPKRDACYRFRAVPDELIQSYFCPFGGISGCKYFMEIRPGDRLQEKQGEQDG